MRAILSLVLAVGLSPAVSAGPVFDHSPFTRILLTYVDSNGLVDYAALKADRHELDAYADSLAAVSPKNAPERFPTEADRLAYWINAYNALCLKGVVDAYPVKSVKDIKLLSGFFNRTWFKVGGDSYTLDNIEHDVIRKEFDEPRIHAAINCASMGCPPISSSAYTGEELEAQLDRAIRGFLTNPVHVRIDPEKREVELSKILDWFESDFTGWYERNYNVDDASILDYVALYVSDAGIPESFSQWKVRHIDYDWTLNDVAAVGSAD